MAFDVWKEILAEITEVIVLVSLINWFKQREGQVKYSIGARNGPDAYDSASSVYFALRSGGLIPNTLLGNTDDLRRDITTHGWTKVSDKKAGDIFIWGVAGASEDGYGHAGVLLNKIDIIHCNKRAGGISTDKYDDILSQMGYPPEEIYRKVDVCSPESSGELDVLEVDEGVVRASGWYKGASQELLFMDAATDRKLGAVPLEESGSFKAELTLTDDAQVYVKTSDLVFSKLAVAKKPVDPRVNTSPGRSEKFYFEIIRQGLVVKRGKTLIGSLSWTNELMFVPKARFTIPIEYSEFFGAREEVRIFVNSKIFHGIVTGTRVNKADETISVDLSHVVAEWQYQQITTNLAVKDQSISLIYGTNAFRYPGWNLNYLQSAATQDINYVYSRQNKLDALTKTCELTSDLFWRVGFSYGRTLDIGSFGEYLPYIISKLPSGRSNIRILKEPTIRHDFDKVINAAVVYGEKSDSGMSSMSLRETYNDSGAQLPGFPIVLWNYGINNERHYPYTDFVKLAPNNNSEFAVIDNESMAAEGGLLLEGTFSFNDLAPFNTDGDEVTDADRIRASKTAYDAAVKRLKLSRRRSVITLDTEQLPPDVQVGNRIRFFYDNSTYYLHDCSDELKKILKHTDWFYITSIKYMIDKNGMEYNTVALEKDLQIDRQTDWQ